MNLEFSAKHPPFVKVANSSTGVFKNFNTLLVLSVSDRALDSGKIKMELEKEEALIICSPIVRLIVCAYYIFCLYFVPCHYISYDATLKYIIMFNQLIKPRQFPSFNSETIYFNSETILFCNNSIVPPNSFRDNHHVPLIFCSETKIE